MLFEGLVDLLSRDPTVSALLGGRIGPVNEPNDNPTYPYCIYRDIAGGDELTLDGAANSHKTIQFDVFCTAYVDGKNALLALRNVLQGYNGTLSEGTRVLRAVRGNQQDNFANDQKIYHSFAEYEFEYVEP